MAYKLLGFLVWQGGKLFLRRKYGAYVPPKPVLVGVLVAVGVAGALVAARSDDDAAA